MKQVFSTVRKSAFNILPPRLLPWYLKDYKLTPLESYRVCVWKYHCPLSKELPSEGNLVNDIIIWTYFGPY